MNISTEKLENNKIALTITIPQADVAKAYDRAWRRISAKMSVPGFRKGKAPRKIIEQRVGLPAIKEEAFDDLAQNAFRDALRETGILPVSRPDVDAATMEEDQDMVFKVTVTVRPEVTLGQYKGLQIEKITHEITDADVDDALKKFTERKAVMTVVEDGALEQGDFAVIDFAGMIDGKPFQGGEGKGYPLEIGSGSFIPGFEEQLIGARATEERVVKVTFPDDYFTKELSGKEAEFKVIVHDVKRKQLPEANDDFIKENSDFATLEDWRADCRENLTKAAGLSANNDYENKLIKAAIDNAGVDIPDVMVDDRISEIIGDMTNSMRQRGLNFDDYLKYMGKTLEELRESHRPGALADVKAELVMDEIAKQENIQVEALDLQDEIEQMSKQYKQTPAEILANLERTGNISFVRAFIQRRKAARFVVREAAEPVLPA